MSRKYFLQLLSLQLLALYCRSSNANPLLGISAKPARKNEFPFIVSLCRREASLSKEHHFCGGSLITGKHVLTSSHCFDRLHYMNVVVVVGHIEIEKGFAYDIRSFIEYEDWARGNNLRWQYSDNDIGIITLTDSVGGIRPGVISGFAYDDVVAQRNVVTAGWGSINERDQAPLSLQKAYLRVFSAKEYKFIHENWPLSKLIPVEPNKYFTVSNPPVIIGCGDSGSPLLSVPNGKIIGVNDSRCLVTDSESIRNAASYHIAVDYYRDFIASVTQMNCSRTLLAAPRGCIFGDRRPGCLFRFNQLKTG